MSNVKGIYVITDLESENLYVGTASANTDGIWQRWASYADLSNITDGNKEFIDIINKFGKEYILKNFQYSILEIFDTKTKVDAIIYRENYWKKVLDTKCHGMNHN